MKLFRLGLLAVYVLAPAAAGADYRLTTTTLDLQFSESGVLLSAAACYPLCAAGPAGRAERTEFGGPDRSVVDHGLIGGDWAVTPATEGGTRVLRFEQGSKVRVTWRIPDEGYRLRLEVEGISGGGLTVQSGAGFSPRPLAGFGGWLERIRYVATPGREVDFGGDLFGLEEPAGKTWQTDGWVGFRNRYWTVMVQPGRPTRVEARAGGQGQDAVIHIPAGPGNRQFDVYLGPVEVGALQSADPELKGLLFGALWFWLRWISFALLWLWGVVHSGLAVLLPASISKGLSIMGLSLAVHILMRPLTRIADRLQDEVHAIESRLAPKLLEIRSAHKGEAQAEGILALYKHEGVHPLYSLRSLLGVAIVIPVFIGAFDMLAENIHLLGVSFLWISDLSQPDAVAQLPFELPFFGSSLNLLPFLMTGLSVLASGLHRSPAQHPALRRRQLRNMFVLAAAFFVLFYTFPSGMVLYWTTNNLISALKGGWGHLHSSGHAGEQGERG